MDALTKDLGLEGRSEKTQKQVYEAFSCISLSHEEPRKSNLGVSEVSRTNQYLSKMMGNFERMRNIAQYRTPEGLRAYSRVFLNIFPIAFGPYFAYLSAEADSFPYVGYMVAVLYSPVLVTLDNLQEHLEDPFDGIGVDDVRLTGIHLHHSRSFAFCDLEELFIGSTKHLSCPLLPSPLKK